MKVVLVFVVIAAATVGGLFAFRQSLWPTTSSASISQASAVHRFEHAVGPFTGYGAPAHVLTSCSATGGLSIAFDCEMTWTCLFEGGGLAAGSASGFVYVDGRAKVNNASCP